MKGLNFIDDKGGKPVAIQMHIGRQPRSHGEVVTKPKNKNVKGGRL